MTEWILRLIEQGGYWGIAFLMFVENVFPPIPSEVIMGLGGIAVARGTMDFWPLLLVGTAGSTAGNYVWFLVGDRLGYERLQPFIDRWGRWLTIDWQHMEAASRFFHSHGQWVVFFLRFSPFMRTLISLPAGLAHMSVWRFLLFTTAGAAIWNALLVFGGSVLARYLKDYEAVMSWVVLGIVALALVGYIWRVLTWKPREACD